MVVPSPSICHPRRLRSLKFCFASHPADVIRSRLTQSDFIVKRKDATDIVICKTGSHQHVIFNHVHNDEPYYSFQIYDTNVKKYESVDLGKTGSVCTRRSRCKYLLRPGSDLHLRGSFCSRRCCSCCGTISRLINISTLAMSEELPRLPRRCFLFIRWSDSFSDWKTAHF